MNNKIKNLLLTGCAACTLIASSAYAQPTLLSNNSSDLYAHGVYIGIQGGYTELHNQYAFSQTVAGVIMETLLFGADHFGGGGYLGYRYNDYLGAEIGYIQLANMKETGGLANVNNHTKVKCGNIFVKGSWPLAKWFSPFVKAGAAYVHQDILSTQNGGATILYKSKTSKVMPACAAGLDFHCTKAFAIDLTWTHMFKSGEIHSIDFTSLGLSYIF
jgi:opacity protein-like surface antigen